MPRARSLQCTRLVFEQKGAWDNAISTAASTCIAQTRRALEERAVAALLPRRGRAGCGRCTMYQIATPPFSVDSSSGRDVVRQAAAAGRWRR